MFGALDRFDDELTGNTHASELHEIVSRVFQDFSELCNEDIRKNFAGSVTGPTGTDSVDVFGYVNFLKDCDAAIQWTLFMPDLVRQQQDGFEVTCFEYKKMPAIRFIGIERDFSKDPEGLSNLLHTLNSLSAQYRCGLDCDILLLHHHGKGVDVEPCHGLWGRFMAKDTPVPDGFSFVDFVPQNDGKPGSPYISQFARAEFSGNPDSMHRQEGFDSDAMYDVTRNIILGQNVCIPYPDKYWTAEVFPDGFTKNSTIYLFCAETSSGKTSSYPLKWQ